LLISVARPWDSIDPAADLSTEVSICEGWVAVNEHPRTLADRLTYLFEHVRRPADSRKFTHDQVAHAVAEATGKPCHRAYISALCTGTKDNPTKAVLEALAAHFDVSPAFFFDDEKSARIVEQLELVRHLRDGGVREVAMRS
jgi:transcriptional regulator with XRE-family HTH domain